MGLKIGFGVMFGLLATLWTIGTDGDIQWVLDPVNLLICASISVVFVGYFSVLLYLYDTGRWYCILFAILISGLGLLIWAVLLRGLYRFLAEKIGA